MKREKQSKNQILPARSENQKTAQFGLELKSISTHDFRTSLADWQPETLQETWVNIDLTIRETQDNQSASFCLLVSTAEAFRLHDLKRSSIELGIHTMIVERWDWPNIRQEIADMIAGCQKATWAESLKQLSQHFTRE